MAKLKYIDIDIYKTYLTVFVGNHKEFLRWLKKKSEEPDDDCYGELLDSALSERKETAAASFYWNRKTRTIIVEIASLSTNYNRLGEIIHELDHAAFYILDECDVYIGEDDISKEAHTYLLELLVRGTFNKEGYEMV